MYLNNKPHSDSIYHFSFKNNLVFRIFLYFFFVFISLYFLSACRGKATEQKYTHEEKSKTDTINHPELVRPQADGSLLLRAEFGRAIGPKIKYMPKLRVFGYFTSSDRVEWDVEVENSGEYEVWLEWAIPDEEAGKPYVFIAGDEQLRGTVASTGSFYTHKTQKVGQIYLSSGIQKMIFKPDSKFEDGELIDLRGVWLEPIK
jgi:hypothetical protein